MSPLEKRARRGSQSAGRVLFRHLGAGYVGALTLQSVTELYTSVSFPCVSSASVEGLKSLWCAAKAEDHWSRLLLAWEL